MFFDDLKNVTVGDALYFVETDHRRALHGLDPYYIELCVLDDVLHDDRMAYVSILRLADWRRINGVPIDEFQSETEWKKLPRDWTYNTELFKFTNKAPDKIADRIRGLRIDSLDNVRLCVREGILVKRSSVYSGTVEAEIAHGMYRVVKKIHSWTYDYGRRESVGGITDPEFLFQDYAQAAAKRDALIEARRQELSLSDEEWNEREIRKYIRRHFPDMEDAYMDALMKLPNFWDVEVKKADDWLAWRYWTPRGAWGPVDELLVS